MLCSLPIPLVLTRHMGKVQTSASAEQHNGLSLILRFQYRQWPQ